MRTEGEVKRKLDALERINSAITARRGMTDEDIYQFNNNARIICALQWVMGKDTLRHTTSKAEGEL